MKEQRQYDGVKIIFSPNGVGTRRQTQAKKKKNLDMEFTRFTKLNSKWITDLNVKHKTIKFLEGDIG